MSMLPVGFGGGASYDIAKSVRFRSSASAYLSDTLSTPTDNNVWTWSAWVKRGALGVGPHVLWGADPSTGGSNIFYIRFDNDALNILQDTGGATSLNATTTAAFRDPSAWYHIQVVFNTDEATSTNRLKVYVNSVLQTLTYAVGPLASGAVSQANTAKVHNFGRLIYANVQYFDGYLSEVNFIDGQALDATSFGEFDANGVWQPKRYSGTYGTNGFYLPFSNGTSLTTLCADASGNANNWTASGVSLTAGVNYDWMDDTPTNNFAVLNSLNATTQHAYSAANLLATLSSASDPRFVKGSVFVSSGKWVAEYKPVVASSIGSCGVGDAAAVTSGGGLPTANSVVYYGNGVIYRNGVSQGTFSTYTTTDTIRIELDVDALTCAFYKNGTLVTTITGLTSSAYTFGGFANNVSDSFAFNFGQQPWQGGTPSSGFKAISTKNLPAATIENPRLHFDIALATGASIKSTAEAVFPSNYLEWIKDRGNANNHQLIDTVRGSSAVLQSNTTAAETTYTAPSGSSVGWVWKAGGAAVTNTSGSISSQVSANTTAGFSVVTYTGTGANATVGHGLGVAPKMVIVKNRADAGAGSGWVVGNTSIGWDKYLVLNSTAAQATASIVWQSAAPSSSAFSIGTSLGVNTSAITYVAYCFAEVPGFSKIGSYTGNGSTDGPFVYCGFRPRWVLIKNVSSGIADAGWAIIDAARSPENVVDDFLQTQLSAAEASSAGLNTDFTANGFKVRNVSTAMNASGNTIIFMAFAEAPFQSSRAR